MAKTSHSNDGEPPAPISPTTVTAITTPHPTREFPVCVLGPVFLDVIMTGLTQPPAPGEEHWVPGCEIMPGGNANQAVALARLGLPVALCCYLGRDRAGSFVRTMLTEEGIDLAWAQDAERQSVTVSLAYDGDRAMITRGSEDAPPLSSAPLAPAVLIANLRTMERNRTTITAWRRSHTPATVIGQVGWDPTGRWDPDDLSPLSLADVFVPNDAEATHYTRTTTASQAARALAERVPLAVVTCGERGLVACDGEHEIILPAAPVQAVDTTGAGDSLTAGLTWALAHGLPLRAALSAACLTASFTVGRPGGSTNAPTAAQVAAHARSLDLDPAYDLSFLDLLDDLAQGSTGRPEGAPTCHTPATPLPQSTTLCPDQSPTHEGAPQ